MLLGLKCYKKGCGANIRDHTPFISFRCQQSLLALMTILAQSLLTLVSSHLVALLLLSVWHSS